MKHYQDHDPLHGFGKANPKRKRANNGGPIVALSDYPVTPNTEPRRPHTSVGSRGMLSVAMLMAATMSMGANRR